MEKACIYGRVSLPTQHIDTQLIPLRELAAKRGYELIAEYCDNGVSGTKARRPGLDAMMLDARRRKFSVVLVAAFDRIARSTRHFLQVLDELDSLNIQFISAREAIDTTGPMGRLFVTLIGSIAQLEGELIRDRIRQGLARVKAQGGRLGRIPLSVDHAEIARDRLTMSLTQTAKKHGISRASVVRFVREANQQSAPAGQLQPVPVGVPAQLSA